MKALQIKKWRLSLGLTQQEAADLLGVSWRQYARYEAGDTPIPMTISIICEYIFLDHEEVDL